MPKRMQLWTLMDGAFPMTVVVRPDEHKRQLAQLLHWCADEDDGRAYIAEREEIEARGRR